MTWQCPRCMVSFEEHRNFSETPSVCEMRDCDVRYHDKGPGHITMHLVRRPDASVAMAKYREHFYKQQARDRKSRDRALRRVVEIAKAELENCNG